MKKRKNIITIAIDSPAAAGAGTVAKKLAKHYKTDVISADSRQFYKQMKIGTSVPNNKQLKKVKVIF